MPPRNANAFATVGRENSSTALGAALYLGGRVVYLPLYALGIPVVRTLAFVVALVGLGMITGLLGLIVVIPLIAHASWHAYRDLTASKSPAPVSAP